MEITSVTIFVTSVTVTSQLFGSIIISNRSEYRILSCRSKQQQSNYNLIPGSTMARDCNLHWRKVYHWYLHSMDMVICQHLSAPTKYVFYWQYGPYVCLWQRIMSFYMFDTSPLHQSRVLSHFDLRTVCPNKFVTGDTLYHYRTFSKILCLKYGLNCLVLIFFLKYREFSLLCQRLVHVVCVWNSAFFFNGDPPDSLMTP